MNSPSLNITDNFFHFTKARTRELMGIGAFLLAIIVMISLLSYNSLDPSYNVAADTEIQNWMGAGGAIIADFLLQSVGAASGFVVLALLGWSWRLFFRHRPLKLLFRLATLFLSLIALSYLFSLMAYPSSWPISGGLGGAVGSLIEAQLPSGLISTIGAILMIVVFLITGGIATGLDRFEWKNIGLFMAYCSSQIIHKTAQLFRKRPKAGFSQYRSDEGSLVTRLALALSKEQEDETQSKAAQEEKPKRKSGPRISLKRDRSKAEVVSKPKAKSQTRVQKKKAGASEQTSLQLARHKGQYELPDVSLLKEVPKTSRKYQLSESAMEQNARLLESVLHDFGVKGEIIGINPGPVVTLYELEPAAGTKSSRVIGLADDIARSMSAISARISVIPGRNALGIELPNTKRETVYFRELLESSEFSETTDKLPMALGKDIGGNPIVVDLAKMPHLLVAGTTGSGKSVSVNTMIASLLYHHTPDECKFIMIDPKMLELSVYEGIPHLLCPVVTEPPKAVVALKWVTKEMENRYRLMANLGVRNLEGYNKRIGAARDKGEELKRTVQTGFDPETGKPIYEDQAIDMNPLPFIVVVVDEMADLMLVAGKDIEGSIQRLAQMARAAGIHIIMATQRPSVDVITGVIKANFPSRISFQVSSRIDSRTILGDQGAEQLLGMGDMLHMAGGGRTTRVHGPFISDKEIGTLVDFLKTQGEPEYVEEVTLDPEESDVLLSATDPNDEEAMLYQKAVSIVKRDGKASTSYLQRCLRIGYNRAARLVDQMEAEGIVSAANHVGKREVIG